MQENKIVDVSLGFNDLLPLTLPHNDPRFLSSIGMFPYKEQTYLMEKDKFLKSSELQEIEEIKKFNQSIYFLKQEHLLVFLEIQKYDHIPLPQDINIGPKVISILKFGN